MKTAAGLVTVLVGMAWWPEGLRAEVQSEPVVEASGARLERTRADAKPMTRMQRQLNQVIREKAGITGLVPVSAADGPMVGGEATLLLDPMIVEGEKVKDLPAVPQENKVQEVLRTGTLWEHKGPRFTRRFWIKGDRGIGFTLSW